MKLELDGWNLGLTFSACHFIPGHDKCCRLHGHNYGILLDVEGEMDEQGVVFDFIELKNAVRKVIADLDHRVLLPGNSNEVELQIEEDCVKATHQDKSYSFPTDDVAILDVNTVSAEMMASFIMERVLSIIKFPPNVHRIEIGVDEGKGQGARVCREL